MKHLTYSASLLLLASTATHVFADDWHHEKKHHHYSGAELNQPCETLSSSIYLANTEFTGSTSFAAGELAVPGQQIPAHCQLTGKMHERISSFDGQTYAIGFEMRLPKQWNGRFFYQANGGIDGNVNTALGSGGGGGPLVSALQKGFAVISSDAGHTAAQNPFFGVDPQARLDYGYQAVGKLTPMAKAVIEQVYGKKPRYSYIGGCSNGGRHTMVAAARYPDQYDGFLVGSPGFDLPQAAVANIYGAQQYAQLADFSGPGLPDLSAAYTMQERRMVADAVLAKCDALDGLADGIINQVDQCQQTFNLETDVPSCSAERDGSCLTDQQKSIVGNILAGAVTSDGQPIYQSFPVDAGIATGSFEFWDFFAPLVLDSGSVGFVMSTPPLDPATFNPVGFALGSDIDALANSIYASNDIYTESGMEFMTPPDAENMRWLKKSGGKMIVYHGVSDQIFSINDTKRWFQQVNRGNRKDHENHKGHKEHHHRKHGASDFARLYQVPGMGHCSGGPATDQFDMLTPLMRWVEHGKAPQEIVATARGLDNPGGSNNDLPSDWSADRSRLLCPYPKVAVYRKGDQESASSFRCR